MVEGCENGLPADFAVDPDSSPARCEPGFPAPVPLAERQTITYSTSSLSSENSFPMLLAIDQGEFEKENIEVNIEVLPTPDQMQLLAEGEVDLSSNYSAALFNLVQAGFPITIPVAGNYSSAESKDGLWATTGTELADFKGKTLAASVVSTNAFYGAWRLMNEAGVSIQDINVLQVGQIQETVIALQNGAADAAFAIAPFWAELDAEPDKYQFLAPFFPLGEPGAGLIFGSRLAEPENEELAAAILRAYVRTVSTYFAEGDWKTRPEMLEHGARILGIPAETLALTPGTILDYVHRDGTIQRTQEMFRDAGALDYEPADDIPEGDIIRRDLLEMVLTKQE
ncbi:MAG: ABC transporter substrate-binding protein [Acidimicrobiia bacterium]